MPRRKGLFTSLAAKLIVTISVLMFIAGAVTGVLFYSYQNNLTLQGLARTSVLTSDLLLQSLRHGMVTGGCETARTTVADAGKLEYIKSIRIYNASGELAYKLGDAAPAGQAPFGIKTALTGLEAPPTLIRNPASGEDLITLYKPIRNMDDCSSASCHAHPPNQAVLGALETSISTNSAFAESRKAFMGSLAVGLGFILSIAAVLLYMVHRMVTRPLVAMEHGVTRIAEGDFDHPLDIKSGDEIGRLGLRINDMAAEMSSDRRKLENWAHELELEVDRKTSEIREAQDQLINAEKLASLGRMAAGVAHEINNPLTGIITFSHLLRDRVPKERKDDIEDLTMIIEQAERCSRIIKGLLGFSRKGTSERCESNISDLVQSSVSILRNQAAFQNIELTMDTAPSLPCAVVDGNQIQQVILNLLTNAADAMNNQGSIHIATRTMRDNGKDYIEVEITDSGPGIPPDNMGRIFEPFFTTKAVGKGTGLGLPVSYGIIKRHGGDLLVRSKLGKGATFLVRLPYGSEKAS